MRHALTRTHGGCLRGKRMERLEMVGLEEKGWLFYTWKFRHQSSTTLCRASREKHRTIDDLLIHITNMLNAVINFDSSRCCVRTYQ